LRPPLRRRFRNAVEYLSISERAAKEKRAVRQRRLSMIEREAVDFPHHADSADEEPARKPESRAVVESTQIVRSFQVKFDLVLEEGDIRYD
jgi:hypothetical protein